METKQPFYSFFSAVRLQVRQGERELERDGTRQMQPLRKNIGTSGFCVNPLQFVRTFMGLQ